MRGRVDTGAACTLAALALVLALPARPEQAKPSFPATSELVSVDVLVLDKQGQPVEGLSAADFTLSEDGQTQAIASFEAVSLSESAARPAARTRVSTNAVPAERPERSFVVVFDEVNLTPYTVLTARQAVKQFLASGVRPGDVVTIVPSGGGPWWTERLPEGRPALEDFLDRLQSKFRPDTTPARLSDFEALQLHYNRDPQILSQVLRRYYENGVLQEIDASGEQRRSTQELGIDPGAALVRARAMAVYQAYEERVKRTLGTFERVAAALQQAKGRKTVLFVSEGFAYDGTQTGFRDVVRASRDANAAFYFVDARGLLGASGPQGAPGANAEDGRPALEQDTLSTFANPKRESEGAESVAIDTGGYSIRNTNNLAERMRAVAEESRAYYLLGYTPGNARRDGKFRKIAVRVSRPGVDVRARRGYYAPKEGEGPKARAESLDPRVRAALDAPTGVGGLRLRLVAHGLGPVAPGKSAALLVAEVDLADVELRQGADQAHSGVLETYVVVSSRESSESKVEEKLVELALPPAVYQHLREHGLPIFREFQLAPGEYQARFVARDRQSGRVGSVRHEFTVPDPAALGTSTPIFTDQLQPAGPQGPARPVPIARRSFKSGAPLYYAFEVYGAGRDAGGGPRVSSSYVIRREDGSELTRMQAQALPASPQGQLAQMLTLSLQDAAPGTYELVLTVRDDVAGRSVEVSEPFIVEG